jgi:hypothetical protein
MTTMAKFTGYTIDQRVEVNETDFKTAGWPKVWRSATVVAVKPVADTKLVDVDVKLDHDGRVTAVRVGPRGGNRVIRAAVA